MSSIDDGIVTMQFDNESFEKKLGATLASLDKLSESLQFAGAGKGFADISAAADSVNLSGMASAVENISSKFSALGAIGFAVIQKLTNEAINFAQNVADKIIDPILTGGKNRAKNIEQAQFMFRGLGIDVEAGMKSALDAVRGTAFGLDEAATAAAQFGASGIKVGEDMTSALRGVAGAAALTGSSFKEIADIFASSAGSGVVNNQDLGQFATRGLNAAAAIAPILGKTEQQVHEMASAGELDFATFAKAMDEAFGEHATKANETYAGSLANLRAAFSRLGAEFFTPNLVQQKQLFNELTPVVDKVHDALKPLISAFVDIKGFGVERLIDSLKRIDLTNFTTGIFNIADGVRKLFVGIRNFIDAIKESFRDVFPKSTTSTFVKFSEAFRDFGDSVEKGIPTILLLRSIFRGFFNIIEIGWTIIKEAASLFKDLIGAILPAGSGLLEFGANAGRMTDSLNHFLVEGGGIHNFFLGLREAVKAPIEFIQVLKDKLVDFFTGISNVSGGENRITSRFQELSDTAKTVGDAWDRFTDKFQAVFDVLDRVWERLKDWFGSLGDKLAAAFQPGDFDAAVDILNVGLLGGIALLLKKFLSGNVNIDFSGGLIQKIKVIGTQLTTTFQNMQLKLKAEALLKIAAAIAVITASMVALSLIDSASLTKALVAISVGMGQLVAVMLLMDKFVDSAAAATKLNLVATAMIGISFAIGILAISITILSKLDMAELGKGLLGVGAGLAMLVLGTKLITTDVSGLIRAGIALGVISSALVVLSIAVKAFSTLSWADMATGLVGIGAGLAIIVLAMNNMPPSSVLSGLGFIEIAIGLTILAGAVKLFSMMSWEEMGKGLLGIAGALLVIAGAMKLMPLSLPITAAGVLILSGALVVMAGAVLAMGSMELETLAKGIGAFAAMLLILTIAMNAMSGAVGGAASLVIVSGAMLILSRVLKELGQLEIHELVQGLIAIAAVLAILSAAALLMTPILPELLLLGIALGVVGAAFALFGSGAFLVAKAFEAMGTSGEAGAKGIVAALETLSAALPDIVKAIAKAIIELGEELLKATPLLIRLLEAVISQLLETIIRLAPKFAKAFTVVVTNLLQVIRDTAPDFIETGLELIVALLTGIRDHIADIVQVGVDLIVNLADSIIKNMPRLVETAVDLIVSFLGELGNHATELVAAGLGLLAQLLQGIADNIGLVTDAIANVVIAVLQGFVDAELKIVTAGANMIIQLVQGITDNIAKVIEAVTEIIVEFLKEVANNFQKIEDAGFDILVKLMHGISSNISKVIDAVTEIITTFITEIGKNVDKIITTGTYVLVKFLDGLGDNILLVIKAGVELVIKLAQGIAGAALFVTEAAFRILVAFIEGLADAIDKHSKDLREAGKHLAGALLDGFTFGLASQLGDAISGTSDFGRKVEQAAKDSLGVNSPSRKFIKIGQSIAQGLVLSLNRDKSAAKSAENLSKRILEKFRDSLRNVSNLVSDMGELNPVITPILDLTKVEAESRNLERFMRLPAITPEVSFQKAKVIATTAEENRAEVSVSDTGPREITFIQNNNSPKALSTSDIYRGTKSQIALSKEELGIAS